MSGPSEMLRYKGRQIRRFVSYPEPVLDGTIRCGVCGQLDDEEFHDEALCTAIYDSNRAAAYLADNQSKEG